MDNRRKHGRNDDGVNDDSPMYSRLFIVCERRVTEEQFKDEFAKFGVIEDVKMPRDYNTGEPKGIAFVKFAKTSDAANALEQMNRTVLPNTTRPLKIMVAANRSMIQSEDNDEDKYKRLFLTIPKNMNEEEVEDIFGKYGHVESVQIQRDRNTGEAKGFAYVKFSKFSEAADAFESCDKRYRAVFALPKGYNKRQETAFEHNVNSLASSSNNMRASLLSMMNPSQAKGYTKIDFMCCPYLHQFQLEGLFNIIPGMQYCHFFVDWPRNCGKGTVTYSNPVSASYAVEKLNKFEYPPGMKIFVRPTNQKFDPQEEKFSNLPKLVSNLKGAIASTVNSATPDLAQLAEAVAEASKVIKMATAGVLDDEVPSSNDLNYCSVKLPPPQPLADIDSNVAKRCFLVCKPVPPTLPVLRDIFCRFGDLINVYTLPNKTVGYARYASVEAAENAIKTLHGAEVCGVRMKVLEADEEAPSKRPRWD